jgi:hypothetical protein
MQVKYGAVQEALDEIDLRRDPEMAHVSHHTTIIIVFIR